MWDGVNQNSSWHLMFIFEQNFTTKIKSAQSHQMSQWRWRGFKISLKCMNGTKHCFWLGKPNHTLAGQLQRLRINSRSCWLIADLQWRTPPDWSVFRRIGLPSICKQLHLLRSDRKVCCGRWVFMLFCSRPLSHYNVVLPIRHTWRTIVYMWRMYSCSKLIINPPKDREWTCIGKLNINVDNLKTMKSASNKGRFQ